MLFLQKRKSFFLFYFTHSVPLIFFAFLLCSPLPHVPLYASEKIKIYENSGSFTPISLTRSAPLKSAVPTIDFINLAQQSLDIEIYEMREPSFQEAVLSAVKRGVSVRLVVEPDPVGNSCDAFSKNNKTDNRECELSYQFTEKFKQAAKVAKVTYKDTRPSTIRYFNKKSCWDPVENKVTSCFQHGKMMIRDQQDILISTGNFNDSSLCVGEKRTSRACNRDYSIIISNVDKAKIMSEIFQLDLALGATCDLPPKSPRPNDELKQYTEALCTDTEPSIDPIALRQKITGLINSQNSSPYSSSQLTASPVSANTLLSLLRNAKKSIRIETQYLKDPDWHAELIAALKRGVKVSITLASLCHFNKGSGSIGSISYNDYNAENGYFKRFLNPLRSGKAQIHVYNLDIPSNRSSSKQTYNGYLHSKIFIIDDKIAWIGSVNGSHASTNINREYGIIIDDPSVALKMAAYLDFNFNQGMTLEQHVPPYLSGENQGSVSVGSCRIAPRPVKVSENEEDDDIED